MRKICVCILSMLLILSMIVTASGCNKDTKNGNVNIINKVTATNKGKAESPTPPSSEGDMADKGNTGSTTPPGSEGDTTDKGNAGSPTPPGSEDAATDKGNAGSPTPSSNKGNTSNKGNAGSPTPSNNKGNTSNKGNTGSPTPSSNSSANESAAIVGKWKSEIDFSELFTEAMTGGDEELAQYFEIKDIYLTFYFTFNKDGTYKLELDKEASAKNMEKLQLAIVKGYVEVIFAGMGVEITFEEFLAESGMTTDEVLSEIMGDESIDEMVEEFEETGKWKVKGNKLYTTIDGEFDESEYDTFVLSGNKLTLLETFGEFAEENNLIYPIVMIKVK